MVNEELLIKFIETFYDKLTNDSYPYLLTQKVTINIMRMFPAYPWYTDYHIPFYENITPEDVLNNPDFNINIRSIKGITIQDILNYPDLNWNFYALSSEIPIHDIEENPDLPWDKIKVIFYNQTTNIEYIKENLNESILLEIKRRINDTNSLFINYHFYSILDKEFIELYLLNGDINSYNYIKYIDIDNIENIPELLHYFLDLEYGKEIFNYVRFDYHNKSFEKLLKEPTKYPNIYYSQYKEEIDKQISVYRFLNSQENKEDMKKFYNKFTIENVQNHPELFNNIDNFSFYIPIEEIIENPNFIEWDLQTLIRRF